jgi:hypothetical protein
MCAARRPGLGERAYTVRAQHAHGKGAHRRKPDFHGSTCVGHCGAVLVLAPDRVRVRLRWEHAAFPDGWNPRTQVRSFAEIKQVKEWRGRGGLIGYRLSFRDGGKVYLEYSVANSIALADQLRRDAKG